MPSSRTQKRRATRTAGRWGVPWPSWLPRCTGRGSPGPGLPREEGRRVLENVTLLLQALDTLAELSQFLALGAREPVIAFPPVARDLLGPVAQRLLRHAQALSHVTDRPARAHQLDRLLAELIGI